MDHAEFLTLLLPPDSYDANGATLSVELAGTGAALDAAQARVQTLLREADSRTVQDTLADWERVYGLPDPCVPAGRSFAQRVASLVARVLETGSLTRDYYIAQATALGYPGSTLTEFWPMTCNGECDDAVYGEQWRYVWQLTVPQSTALTGFSSQSPCSDPLRDWSNSALECVFARIKPAHTFVLFAYGV